MTKGFQRVHQLRAQSPQERLRLPSAVQIVSVDPDGAGIASIRPQSLIDMMKVRLLPLGPHSPFPAFPCDTCQAVTACPMRNSASHTGQSGDLQCCDNLARVQNAHAAAGGQIDEESQAAIEANIKQQLSASPSQPGKSANLLLAGNFGRREGHFPLTEPSLQTRGRGSQVTDAPRSLSLHTLPRSCAHALAEQCICSLLPNLYFT